MSTLKRKNTEEIVEISDDEGGSPPPVKKFRNEDTIDLTLSEDDEDEATPRDVAKVERSLSPYSPPSPPTLDQAVFEPAAPTVADRPVESIEGKAKIPEAADRYVPSINVAENTEYRSPYKFCMKPPFWQKWSGNDYLSFVEELRSQFGTCLMPLIRSETNNLPDPHPFSRRTGKPVEEVLHVWSALVAAPLYDTIEAKKRGEEGMQKQFEVLNKFGTPNRPWADGKFHGELHNIKAGTVLLITQAEGNKEEVKVPDLSKADLNYLKTALDDAHWKVLIGDCEVE